MTKILVQDLKEKNALKGESSKEPMVLSVPSPDLNSIVSVHIAEGPGGFIEAIRYIRKGCSEDFHLE